MSRRRGDPVEEIELPGGQVIKAYVEQDDDPQSPDDWGNDDAASTATTTP